MSKFYSLGGDARGAVTLADASANPHRRLATFELSAEADAYEITRAMNLNTALEAVAEAAAAVRRTVGDREPPLGFLTLCATLDALDERRRQGTPARSKPRTFEITVCIYGHNVKLTWWEIEGDISDDALTEDGESRAREMIAADYTSGELQHQGEATSARGWWTIT
jgi:hypothetical protein